MLTLLYYVNACPAIPNNPINSFLFSSFEELFHFVGYHAWKGLFSEVLNFFATIVWNYNDILIMCISVALSGRFRQLNEYMAVALRRPTSEKFWIRSREHYRSLCQLCDKVDDAVSFITLVCFSNNLFFICGKILKSIQKKPSIAHTLYFWFALFYLLIRTFILSLYTAEINDESKQPLRIFRAVKQDSWCPEVSMIYI
ncbi:gustatory receptor for sugar taste 64e [Teleopsis dalmanni]|uniref:gustatory receptor for sugar taste 64e n=1 Tax=Teleopsis dalmanni TaxID=139649 RepID=UPI0018CD8840|nr:gustatory receptor for sugar taste 64e [Teleopsis dalmanni]